MSRHEYTNPAFCQQSEFYPNANGNKNAFIRAQRSASMRSDARNTRNIIMHKPPTHSHQQQQQQKQQQQQQQKVQKIQQRELPPKPGPKPSSNPNQSTKVVHEQPNAFEGFALVPLADLPQSSKGRYAVLPANEAHMIRTSGSMSRLTKSQDDLDRIVRPFATQANSADVDDEEDDEELEECEDEESFMSLPAITTRDEPPALKRNLASAFSTDFVNKSMILVDQANMQRYAIVPTDDDEEVVDSNHEIIQMHNGRAHRYAVIPTDEEETCLSGEFETNAVMRNYYGSVRSVRDQIAAQRTHQIMKSVEYAKHRIPPAPSSVQHQQQRPRPNQNQPPKVAQPPVTPPKNPIATQKLFELLSTPNKNHERLQRAGSYHTIIHKSPEHRYRSQILCSSSKQLEFSAQKAQHEMKQNDIRTTAVISPRLQQSIYSETTMSSGTDKTWSHESFQKIASATATIGIVSLMLLLTGIMNSGLCLYIVSVVSKTHLQMEHNHFADCKLHLHNFR